MSRSEPVYATLTTMYGDPRARIRIVRRYPSVVKAKMYLGEGSWSGVEDVHPGNVLDDGGTAWGWEPPAE